VGGVEVGIKNLSKSFGKSNIWSDVTLTLPAGEVSVLLGPSGTGKSVLLKSIIGLLKPEKGSIFIHDTDLVRCSESKLYEIRKLFGVLFQDGALFGSMNLFDNVAFPLREHTRKGEKEISDIVMEKLDLVGLSGAEDKLPGEISGGMKKRAGLARALVLDPEIILVDEPDSGLDPVRTAYLNQLIVDLNTQLDATILIVTHHLGTARSLPDNIGMLFRRNLVMFGPREVLLTSEEPVVQQFLQGRRIGPIGMSEEKDSAQMEAEMKELKKKGGSADSEESFIDPQLDPTEGLGERKAVQRRKDRVMQVLHTLPEKAQTAILESLTEEDQERYGISREQDRTELIEITRNQPPEDADPFGYKAMQEDTTESQVEDSPAGEGEGEGENAGSGNPDADAEARKAPPDPPESDEPLVGVPADDEAGGTVVLPQAGEHTKSEEQKADEAGLNDDDQSDGDGDGDTDGEGEGGDDTDDADTSEAPEGSEDHADGDERGPQDQHDQHDQHDDEPKTEQFAAVDTGQDQQDQQDGRDQRDDQGRQDGQDGQQQDGQGQQGRHAAGDGGQQGQQGGPQQGRQGGQPAGLGLVAMDRAPGREVPSGSAGRGDDRGGWAVPAAAGDPGAQGNTGHGAADQLAGPPTGAPGQPNGGQAGNGGNGNGGGHRAAGGGLRRLFRRGDS
jgi:phospholipid/cholesterol/gamma-HCH transport system ATP-binding protein